MNCSARLTIEFFLLGILAWSFAGEPTVVLAAPGDRGESRYAPAEQLGLLEHEDVSESSGLAPSLNRPGVFWTHNDSGDGARLFAFDSRGRHLDQCRVLDAAADDWEDMASFRRNGRNYLLVADVGDNARRRPACVLYVLEEPQAGMRTTRPVQTIRFTYKEGPQDCEAVGVDPVRNQVLLATKEAFRCHVYTLPLPDRTPSEPLVAQRLASLLLPQVTGLDISADQQQLVFVTYAHAVLFQRVANASWREALQTGGEIIALPPRRQGEAICFGTDGRSLYLTSEGRHDSLWRLVPRSTSGP